MLANRFKYMYHQIYISDKLFSPFFLKNHGKDYYRTFCVLVLIFKDHLLYLFPHAKKQLYIYMDLAMNFFFHIDFFFYL